MSTYIIDFVNSATQEEMDSYIASINATVLTTFSVFDKVLHVECEVVPPKTDIVDHVVLDDHEPLQLLNTVIISDQTAATVVQDGSVPIITLTPDDQNWWKYYSLNEPDYDAPSYVTNRRGAGNIIYVLDSGIELSHPEFSEADVQNLFTFNGDFTDKRGHGTAIASVIVGKTCGLTDSTVKSVKIFDPDTPTKQSDMLAALDAIYNDYTTAIADHYIVNCSWTVSKNAYIEDKIRRLMGYGIFFVAAAGNSGTPIGDVTPASMPEVLTIGSYNQDLKPSNFSNYTGTSGITYTAGEVNHGAIDGWAPGENIWSAGLNGTYSFVAGTSIAAGIQSAAIAYNLSRGYSFPVTFFDNLVSYYYSSASLMRPGLLDLSDPKYQNSVNNVTTFSDTTNRYDNEAPIVLRYRITANEKVKLQLFNPTHVAKLEVIGDIFEGFTISSTGKLYGIAPSVPDGEDYRKLIMPVQITYADGNVEDSEFLLYVLHPSLDTEAVTDPELDLVLQADTYCYPGSCSQPAPAGCINNCFTNCQIFGGCNKFNLLHCFCY